MGIIAGDNILPPGEDLEGTKQIVYLDVAPVGTEYAGQAGPGALLLIPDGTVYENQGTLATPSWAQISTV